MSEVVAELCSTPLIDGVTFLGGEPFAQADSCARVARAARARGLSVLVFSGYTLEELRAPDRPSWTELLATTDLLVDGRYEAENPSALRFVGSANQRLHALTARGAALAREFVRGPDIVEVRIHGASAPIVEVRIHGASGRIVDAADEERQRAEAGAGHDHSYVTPVRGVAVTINGTPDAISVGSAVPR